MNRLKILATCSLVLFASTVSAQEASRADFEAFSQAVLGRWVGNLTLNADFAGTGKKGDKLVGYIVYELGNDGQTVTAKFAGGGGSGTWTMAYDAVEKRIRTLWSTSGGDFDQAIIYRQGANWIEEGRGATADGKVDVFKNTLTISDGGNTHTWTGTSSRNGKENAPRHDVFQRVATEPPAGSELLQEFGELMVGRWRGQVVLINDWPGFGKRGDKIDAAREVRWAVDRHAIIVTETGATGASTTMYTWNTISKTIQFLSVSVSGSVQGTLMKLADGDWIETLESGGTTTGEIIGGAVVRSLSEDKQSYRSYGIVTANGQALDELQDVYQKVSQ